MGLARTLSAKLSFERKKPNKEVAVVETPGTPTKRDANADRVALSETLTTPRGTTRFFRQLSFDRSAAKKKKLAAQKRLSMNAVADSSASAPPPPAPTSSIPPPAPPPARSGTSPAIDVIAYEMVVPEGVDPGDTLQATTPSGVKVKLEVPEGARPGTILTFTLPASAADAVALSKQKRKVATEATTAIEGEACAERIVKEALRLSERPSPLADALPTKPPAAGTPRPPSTDSLASGDSVMHSLGQAGASKVGALPDVSEERAWGAAQPQDGLCHALGNCFRGTPIILS